MTASNYVECSNKTKIIDVLLEIKRSNGTVSLWQKNNKGKRIILESYIYDVSPEENAVIIALEKPTLSLVLDIKDDIYVHGSEQSLVFKSPKFQVLKKKIYMTIPKVVKIIDLRDSMRFSLESSTLKKVIHLKEKGLQGSEQFRQHTLDCIDVSQSGMALKLRDSHLTRYHSQDTIKLVSINDVSLEDVEAKLLYIAPHSRDESVKYFKAGFIFSKILTKEQITAIINNADA